MTEDEFRDRLGRLTAASDQAKEATKEVADMLGLFMVELVKAEFSRDEALTLCVTMLREILSQGGERHD